jgi:hypothetical protein
VRCILTPKNKTPKTQQQARDPLVNEAVKMGARIIEEEPNE